MRKKHFGELFANGSSALSSTEASWDIGQREDWGEGNMKRAETSWDIEEREDWGEGRLGERNIKRAEASWDIEEREDWGGGRLGERNIKCAEASWDSREGNTHCPPCALFLPFIPREPLQRREAHQGNAYM